MGTPPRGGEQRLRVYLTNSLEEASSERPNLFMSQWLTEEAAQADVIKRDTPVMCVIGNPPYAVSSTNKNEWIQNLISVYKKDLNERKINLDDDYIKFIRYGQHYIDKNGSGILAYISNNSFIDGITHRQMRKNLLESFDKIYILDLHGNAKKKEVCPDGSADQNVFDIMQGVSINIFVKTGNKKKTELGQVFQSNLQGKREFKYETLNSNTIQSFEWKKLEFTKPNYFFVPKNFDEIKNYEKGFKIDELINSYVSGVESVRDKISIQFNTESLKNVVTDFINLDAIEIAKKYNTEDARDWKIERAKEDVKSNIDNPKVWQNINYRPFDIRKTFYSGKQNGFVCNGRYNVMKHLLEPNIGLLITNKNRQLSLGYAFTTRFISDRHFLDSAADSMAVFPLYLYPETNGQQTIKTTLAFSHPSEGGEFGRVPNLNTEIVNKFAEKLGIPFVAEKSATLNSPPLEGCPQGGVEKKETISTINNTPIKRNFIENLPYNPKLKQLVKDKRKAGILSEVLFWVQVHKGKFHKIDFDRQRIIGNYIVDFYVKTLGLIVEIDGNSHDYKQDYDAERQLYFENLGLKVFRCTDDDVKKNIDSVLMALEDYIIDEYGESRDLTVDVDEKIPPRPLGTPPKEGNFAPIDILDYIYAVLHSPTYREKYKEFLKIDFPRVPYPKDNDTFWQLVKLGGEIRQIHLLESPTVEKYITQYPEDGNNTVTKSKFISSPPLEGLGVVGKVYINDTQYFDNVPQIAWEFFIGGYQPAQKWLKDRKERTLEFDDILHYQKIIVALSETDRLMNEINKIDIE
jgi:predicted helicase/very-short-patch-repair endonuclease